MMFLIKLPNTRSSDCDCRCQLLIIHSCRNKTAKIWQFSCVLLVQEVIVDPLVLVASMNWEYLCGLHVLSVCLFTIMQYDDELFCEKDAFMNCQLTLDLLKIVSCVHPVCEWWYSLFLFLPMKTSVWWLHLQGLVPGEEIAVLCMVTICTDHGD